MATEAARCLRRHSQNNPAKRDINGGLGLPRCPGRMRTLHEGFKWRRRLPNASAAMPSTTPQSGLLITAWGAALCPQAAAAPCKQGVDAAMCPKSTWLVLPVLGWFLCLPYFLQLGAHPAPSSLIASWCVGVVWRLATPSLHHDCEPQGGGGLPPPCVSQS